jgi:orotidine-5'-phosphate decarboxylase
VNRFGISNPIIVALDVDSADECLAIARKLRGHAGAFKIGPRLVVRYGRDLSLELAKLAPLFIDNKYLDIPSTMEGAIRASFDSGATLVTVHAWSGGECLHHLAQVEAELNRVRPFKLLAVTLLTSFSQQSLPPPQNQTPIAQQVLDLSDIVCSSGLTGLVCSSHEVEALRARHPQSFLVTPGIRLPDQSADDQKRITGPAEAIRMGSSALVVGRPIYAAKDPIKEIQKYLDLIQAIEKQG